MAWEAVRLLRQWQDLPVGLETYMVDGGHRILDVLDGSGTLLLVDAVAARTPPGTIHRFDWPDPRVDAFAAALTHELRPAEALRLAAVLGIAPERVVIFGIEVETLGPQMGLSPPVMAALPELMRRLVKELGGDALR